MKPRMKWRKIGTAPTDGTRILLTNGELISIGKASQGEFFFAWSNESDPKPMGDSEFISFWQVLPTHWMPLPALPTP